MIRTFQHRGLERFFTKNDLRGIPAQFAARIERVLDRLDGARRPDDMNVPGYCFHALKGSMKGRFAVAVSGNWRIAFAMDGEDAVLVNLEDDH